MRGDLSKVEGITDITTDIPSRICTFNMKTGSLDLKAILDEFSKTNDHIAGYTIESQTETP